MKYRFINGQRGIHCVEMMARVLEVSRSGYYGWQDRGESGRERANRALAQAIRRIQEKVKYRYGSPRVTAELRRQGMRVGHNRVARIMDENGLGARQKRRFRCTTKASESRPVAENLLGRNFTVCRTNTVWIGDITYIPTAEGWLYLAVVLDLSSRRVVGWSMSSRLTTDLVLRAFWMAVLTRKPPEGLMFHSDRGSQYTSRAFVKARQGYRMIQSMSRRGNCWDNSPCEAFFASLKTELMDGKAFAGRDAAQAAIFEYMEVFYNRQRLHSSLGYMTPVEWEEAISEGYASITSSEKTPYTAATKAVG
jgi:transposase InsO family protein